MSQVNGEILDIIVVGGGPAGLFATYYAGLREASCVLVDSLEALGGRLSALYPEKPIYDIPGFPHVLARDLVARLVEQALQFGAGVRLGNAVTGIETFVDASSEVGHAFRVVLANGDSLAARAVVLASGIGVFSPRRHEAPGAERFDGRGISYVAGMPAEYAGRRVIVAGGGDSAVDWALELEAAGAQVLLVHRSKRFRAHPRSVAALTGRRIEVLTDTEIVEFTGGARLEGVTLRNLVSGDETMRAVDRALIMFGFRNKLSSAETWQVKGHGEDGEILVDSYMETSRSGLYAIGDVACYPGKLKLIVSGFAEAATAVNHALARMRPNADAQPLHSTTVMAERRQAQESGD